MQLDEFFRIGSLKLADFGSCVSYPENSLSNAFCGTFGFSPPEQVLTSSHNPFKSDVWSLACVILEMVQGEDWFVNKWISIWKTHINNVDEFSKSLEHAIQQVKKSSFDEYFKESLVVDHEKRSAIDIVAEFYSPQTTRRSITASTTSPVLPNIG